MKVQAPWLCAMLLSGCASLPVPFPGPDESRQVIDLIGYAQRVAAMPAREQRSEASDANRAYTRDPSAYARLRLALLLSLPGSPIADDAQASELIEPLAARDRQSGPVTQFARLLYAQITDRARERRRAAQLKEQLDAIRAIERGFFERQRNGMQ